MRNFKNNRRRFRNGPFDRNGKINSGDQTIRSSLGNISDFRKKNYQRNNINISKLVQKYSDLAREALSSGDKILYENYLQHAEHFTRISENISGKSINNENSTKIIKEVKIDSISEKNNQQEEKIKVTET